MQLTPNEEARLYFKPLRYEDISESDFYRLVAVLQKHIDKRNEFELKRASESKNGGRDYIYSIKKVKYNKATPKRPYMSMFITVLCDNYSEREAISFNPDGFIGFAGWASTYNTKLFTNAFKEWVDIMKREKVTTLIPVSSLNPEQYKTFINSYYVKEFPENPHIGDLINLNNMEYIYTGKWEKVRTVDTVLEKIRNIKDFLKTDLTNVSKDDIIKSINKILKD